MAAAAALGRVNRVRSNNSFIAVMRNVATANDAVAVGINGGNDRATIALGNDVPSQCSSNTLA